MFHIIELVNGRRSGTWRHPNTCTRSAIRAHCVNEPRYPWLVPIYTGTATKPPPDPTRPSARLPVALTFPPTWTRLCVSGTRPASALPLCLFPASPCSTDHPSYFIHVSLWINRSTDGVNGCPTHIPFQDILECMSGNLLFAPLMIVSHQ